MHLLQVLHQAFQLWDCKRRFGIIIPCVRWDKNMFETTSQLSKDSLQLLSPCLLLKPPIFPFFCRSWQTHVHVCCTFSHFFPWISALLVTGPKADAEQFAFGQNWQQFVERQRISVKGLLSSVREVREMVGGAIQEPKLQVNLTNRWGSWEHHGNLQQIQQMGIVAIHQYNSPILGGLSINKGICKNYVMGI